MKLRQQGLEGRPWLADACAVRRHLVVLAALACVLVVATPAGAWRTSGHYWPSKTIGYVNLSKNYDWSVQWAAYVWNASGADIRFVPTTRDRAQLVISAKPIPANAPEAGIEQSTVVQGDGRIVSAIIWLKAGISPYEAALVATHEFGHALGLDHEDRGCAVMNSELLIDHPFKCRPPAAGKWWCQLLTVDDIKGAVRIYGGKVKDPQRPNCARTR